MSDKIILTAEFRDCPEESREWRGLKGRVFRYDNSNCPDETGYRIYYRKTFEKGLNVKIEMKQVKRVLKDCFATCRTLDQYIENGLSEELVDETFDGVNRGRNLNATQRTLIESFEELYDLIETGEEEWFTNPGGIPGLFYPDYLISY